MPPFEKKQKNSAGKFANVKPVVIKKKKALGQNFLRKYSVVEEMCQAVDAVGKSVLEIGCGDGFLTRAILEITKCKSLTCIELDEEWASLVADEIKDDRFEMINKDILEFNWEFLEPGAPLVLLANLPYNITFPILKKLVQYRSFFSEGVFMVQEEVAQKLTAKTKGVVGISLFFQAYLDLKLLTKVGPEAFDPAPKVNSRTVHFKVRQDLLKIEKEEEFWGFVRAVFHHPRQTVKNNLKKLCYPIDWIETLDLEILAKRPQHLKLDDFLKIWHDNKGCSIKV